MTRLKESYQTNIIDKMKHNFNYKNNLAVPHVSKVVINVGVGEAKENEKILSIVESDLKKLAGQKPVVTTARKAISGFKIRKGEKIGLKVTLRGKKMYDFIERLNSIAFPRIRDFRGLKKKGFDKQGNYNLGIKEHTVFPEIKYDKTQKVFGMQVTVTTTAKSDKEALELLTLLGFPFEKDRSSNG
jgi:large subunit ribosomal protein L5